MATVSLADAKAQLSALVKRAAEGETIRILRRGRPVARITAEPAPRKTIDLPALRALTASMPLDPQDGADLVRAMRDEERY
jgi:prevent-host-death family protein